MTISSILEFRHLRRALVGRIAAAGPEGAAAGRMQGRRNISLEHDPVGMSGRLQIAETPEGKKYLVKSLPDNLADYECKTIEQGYLSITPVVRVRKQNDEYILTYKSGGLMIRKEVELPLDKDSYKHLLKKTDGCIISKKRYVIPDGTGQNIELDIFTKSLEGLIIAEVEFTSESEALSYNPPSWFDVEVTDNPAFQNSTLSSLTDEVRVSFLKKYVYQKH